MFSVPSLCFPPCFSLFGARFGSWGLPAALLPSEPLLPNFGTPKLGGEGSGRLGEALPRQQPSLPARVIRGTSLQPGCGRT